MNWTKKAASLLFGRSIQAMDSEIQDEIQFHLDCRTKDLVLQGVDPMEAMRIARLEFGSQEQVQLQCQGLRYGRSLQAVGIISILFVLLVVAIAGLSYQSWQLQGVNEQLRAKLSNVGLPNSGLGLTFAQTNTFHSFTAPEFRKENLSGTVTDESGAPIASAKIALIYKSWPSGLYRQQAFNAETDKQGNFQFPNLYTLGEQTGVLVTVLADGYVMESHYLYSEKGEKIDEQNFRLAKATPLTVQLIADGTPVENAQVLPRNRQTPSGDEFLLYSQSAKTLDKATNNTGRVVLNYFQKGDRIKLQIDKDGMSEVEFVVGDAPEQTVSMADLQDVIGKVTSAAGNPIADFDIVLIQKSWASGYQQCSFNTKTDKNGRFVFPKMYEIGQKYGFNVTTVGTGKEMTSQYIFDPNGAKLPELNFELKETQQKRFVFRDSQGNALSGHSVAPLKRQERDGKEHIIYAMSAPSIAKRIDDDGYCEWSVANPGDMLTFVVDHDGKSIEVSVNVNNEDEQEVLLRGK